jgi:hypothetical protein
MKKYHLLLPVIFIMASSACQKKVDVETEKEAIRALIYNESQAYLQKDTAKLFSFYIHDDSQTRITMRCDTIQLYQGWEQISTLLGKADFTGYVNLKNTKEFITIKVMDCAAWAMYKDIWTAERNGAMVSNNLWCTMILEKAEGAWKISGFSFHVMGN